MLYAVDSTYTDSLSITVHLTTSPTRLTVWRFEIGNIRAGRYLLIARRHRKQLYF